MKSSKTRSVNRSFARLAAAAVLGLSATAGSSRADEVVLSNGDKLTGKIGLVSGDTLKFTSPALGDMSIKLANIKSYSTDSPATLRLENRQFATGTIKQADATQITTTDGKTYQAADVKRINPPPVGWTGSVVASGALDRGNSNSESLGLSAGAVLRRDTPDTDDRLTVAGAYNFVRTGRGATGNTTTDNLAGSVKYDDFFTDKFYGYGDAGYYHDRIALLNYRLTPGVGVGYQWIEQKTLNFYTEAGVSYLYENYVAAPIDQNAAFRLAYHADTALNDQVSLFNDVEYLAPFRFGETNHYVIAADAGVRANLTKAFFTEFKVVYERNDHPVPGTLKDDLMFLLGVGWKF